MEIVFFGNLPTLFILFFVLKSRNISVNVHDKKLILLRAIFGTIGMVANYYIYKNMILADALGIAQLTPLFVIALSVKFLDEKIDFRQILIFFIAFIGTILIIKPGLRLNMFPCFVGLLGGLSLAVGKVIVRKLRNSEPLIIVNYFAFVSCLCALFVLFWQNNFVLPNLTHLLILIMLGVVNLCAQVSLTMALKCSPASLVSLYTYIQIIFGILIGIIFFKEIPDIFSVTGVFFILITGYLNYKFSKN
jgi:drug/metabolite transporter (DMT)-like permease